MRKSRNKSRKTRNQQAQPPAKRRKTGEETYTRTCRVWEPEWEEPIEQETENDQMARIARKRWNQEETPATKRQRMAKNDIRNFLTVTDIELLTGDQEPNSGEGQNLTEIELKDDGDKVGDEKCQAEHQRGAGDWTDQAEKDDRGDTEEQSLGVTQIIRQSSAKLDAVVRYVGVPISNNHVPVLTVNNPGTVDCQAEQSEASHRSSWMKRSVVL